MQVRELGEFAHRLIHEYAAAVDRGADWVWRDKEDVQLVGLRGEFLERIAEVAAQRTAEGFAVGDRG